MGVKYCDRLIGLVGLAARLCRSRREHYTKLPIVYAVAL